MIQHLSVRVRLYAVDKCREVLRELTRASWQSVSGMPSASSKGRLTRRLAALPDFSRRVPFTDCVVLLAFEAYRGQRSVPRHDGERSAQIRTHWLRFIALLLPLPACQTTGLGANLGKLFRRFCVWIRTFSRSTAWSFHRCLLAARNAVTLVTAFAVAPQLGLDWGRSRVDWQVDGRTVGRRQAGGYQGRVINVREFFVAKMIVWRG